jgi:hypothetical protein
MEGLGSGGSANNEGLAANGNGFLEEIGWAEGLENQPSSLRIVFLGDTS